jgi:predicted DNA-binding transcriptional regulator YafY
MSDAASRSFLVLEKLQRHAPVTAERLSEELGVTTRTVRRDIARLRDLGYPIDAQLGIDGGYSMAPGAVLPPIVLGLDEAVVCTLALTRWAGAGADEGSSAGRALAAIAGAFPERARRVHAAVTAKTRQLPIDGLGQDGPADPSVTLVGQLARACAAGRRIEFRYRRADGEARSRRADPHELVETTRHRYVVVFDLDANGWRTLRLDRISELVITDVPSRPHELPSTDMGEWATLQLAAGWQRVTATVRVHAPAEEVRRWISPAWGTVEPESQQTVILRAGADSYDAIARWVLLIGADVTVIEPEELRQAFVRIADRARTAATAR